MIKRKNFLSIYNESAVFIHVVAATMICIGNL